MANETVEREPLERRRARHAYDSLKNLSDLKKVYTRVQGLPVEVRSHGLTVAVATLIKEDRRESRWLADLLAIWLLEKSGLGDSRPGRATSGNLLDQAATCDRAQYLALQAEALAYLEHVKRLASALEKKS
jgi:hypothetical protein